MTLKSRVDKIEDVEEAQRSLYVERDGAFFLDADYSDVVSAATKKANSEAAKFRHELKAFAELGMSAEEIQALKKAREEDEETKSLKGGEFDKLKKQLVDQHSAELKKKDDSIGNMRSTLEKHLVDGAAIAALAAAKGSTELLLPHVRSKVKVFEDGGEYVARVVDVKGDPRVNAKGDFLSIAELVSEMRSSDSFSRAFDGDGAGGGGMPPGGGKQGSGSSGSTAKSMAEARTPKEKAAFLRSKHKELPANPT